MDKPNKPQISLVGAGPGDPELITLKAIRRLQEADVVLFDSLSNPEILVHANKEAIKIHVGKRAGKHSIPQDEIQLLMVQSAFKYGRVVRLKGGDPFVFGRGHEELLYAQAFDIPVEVIPGISSAISVPASQLIPVTRRGVAESFWVVTATTSEGELSRDLTLAAQSSATIVILMGMRKLAAIARIFLDLGKQEMPAMIIQNGTLANESKIIGTMGTLVDQAQDSGISTPAIIVVGQCVSLHPEFVENVKAAYS